MKMRGRDGTIQVERVADKGHSDRVMSHSVEWSSIFLSLSVYHPLHYLSVLTAHTEMTGLLFCVLLVIYIYI